jgi:Restriction endonuclease
MSFAAAANALRHCEIARLKRYATPPVESMRSLTPGPFRERMAELLQRLGHAIVNDPSAAEILVTLKNGKKHFIMCATPADPTPTGPRPVMRLHDAVIAAKAVRGIYITTRTFTAEAWNYVKGAPISLMDGAMLAVAFERVKTREPIPGAYDAMCYECGAIVQHHLDKRDPLPCVNGHMVAPTIARAAVDPARHPQEPEAVKPWTNMSPEIQQQPAIEAYNHQAHDPAIRQQSGGR